MTLLLATLISLGVFVLTRLDVATRLSPDGRFYLLAGGGSAVPKPYAFRWLAPLLCAQSATRWQVLTGLSLVAWGPLMAFYLGALGFAPWQQLAGVAFLCGLPAMFRLNTELPVLVDAPAFALALASAGCWVSGWTWAAIGLVVAAGACKESAPIFAAVFAWHPALLIGLAGAAWLSKRGLVPAWAGTWLLHPVRSAIEAHRGAWLDWRKVALPWGALAVLAPLGAGLQAGVALALGYGQMLVAQDRARLFGWAAPALIVAGLPWLPEAWALPVCVAHLLNPYRGA